MARHQTTAPQMNKTNKQTNGKCIEFVCEIERERQPNGKNCPGKIIIIAVNYENGEVELEACVHEMQLKRW